MLGSTYTRRGECDGRTGTEITAESQVGKDQTGGDRHRRRHRARARDGDRLAVDGFEVAILGRRANRLEPKKGEKNLHPYVCDVGDRAQIKSTVKAIRAKFGRLNTVVNNAGIVQRATHDRITPQQIDQTFGINLIGMMHMCLECIPALKRARGAIINVSSSLTDRCAH